MKTKTFTHAPKTCGGIYNTEFTEENVPYLKCDKCGHLVDDWIKWDTTYSKFHSDEEKWKDKKNAIVCLLGHFTDLYEKYYGFKYAMTLSEKGLFQGTETAILRRLLKMLGNDHLQTREFISWIFSNKVKNRKKKITSLSFMCVADFVQEFKFAQKRAQTLDRDTLLPEKMTKWLEHFVPNIYNYVSLRDFNDISILLTHYKNGHLKEVKEVATFVAKLQEAGYVDISYNLNNWRG